MEQTQENVQPSCPSILGSTGCSRSAGICHPILCMPQGKACSVVSGALKQRGRVLSPHSLVLVQHHYILRLWGWQGKQRALSQEELPSSVAVGCRMSKVPSHVVTPEKSIIKSLFSLWSILNLVSVQPYLSLCQILLNEVYPALPAWLNIVHPVRPERILYFANIIKSNKRPMVCSDNGIDAVMPHRQSLGFRESFILCAVLAISPAPFLNNFSFYFTSYAGILPHAVYIKNALYMCWKHWVLCCWQGRVLLCLRRTLLYYYHFCLI